MHGNSNDKMHITIILAGVLLFVSSLLFAMLLYISRETSRGSEDSSYSETASGTLSETQASPSVDFQNFEGFLPIRLHSNVSASMPEDLNLYLDGTGNCFFFLPSYLSINDFQLQFDEALYSISIDDMPVHSPGSLASYDTDRQYPVSIRLLDETTGNDTPLTLTFMQSQNLPAIFISTATGSLDYMHASRDHQEPGSFTCILPDGTLDSQGALSAIRCHGNFSFLAVNKKSYQFYFETDTDVLSMGSATRYILQANALDITRMRNEIVYSYCREAGISYAVDTEYVDLYFNGEYAGNYLLCERVEIGADRVALPEDGYLIEKMLKERIKEDDATIQVTGMDWFIVRDPDYVSGEALSLISEYMNRAEALISDCDSLEKYEELSGQIDIDSFADMYLVNAISNDIDSNIASTFYYLYDNGEGLKLYAGPVWDYDNAFGRNARGYDVALSAYPSGYCEELFNIPYFRDKVTDKLNTDYYPLMKQYLTDFIPQLQIYIAPSISMDLCRWRAEGYLPGTNLGRDDSISYLYDYIQMRLDYVYDYINHPEQYHHVRFINNGANTDYRDNEIWIHDGEMIPQDVMELLLDRYECDSFYFGNGKPYSNTCPVFSDMALYNHY